MGSGLLLSTLVRTFGGLSSSGVGAVAAPPWLEGTVDTLEPPGWEYGLGFFRTLSSRRRGVRRHESMLLYPSYAAESSDGGAWSVFVQGSVFDPRVSWLRRRAVMGVIKRALQVESDAVPMFDRRMERFLMNFAGGRRISIRIGEKTIPVAETNAHGLFSGWVKLDRPDFEAWRSTQNQGAWLSYRAVLPEGDQRSFWGEVQPVTAKGVSIISDVDDTIKNSNVPNRPELFRNTFSRRFSPIAGMPELYRQCADLGTAFHYVSGSPWQLFEPLREFWTTAQIPRGSFHLKPFRLRDTARKLRLAKQVTHKRAAIEPILRAFPQRKFVLVGDSGEQDPEIYGSIAQDFPENVAGVFIRGTKQERPDARRFHQAFASLPRSAWQVYTRVEEMADNFLQVVRNAGL